MNIPSRQSIHGLLILIGLALIVGGIAAEKPGASIIGLLVAAINIQQWQRAGSSQVEQE